MTFNGISAYRAFHIFRTKGLKPVFPSNKPAQVFGVICRFTAYTISDRSQLVFDILLTQLTNLSMNLKDG